MNRELKICKESYSFLLIFYAGTQKPTRMSLLSLLNFLPLKGVPAVRQQIIS